ncbi:MAG: hypothetical protein LBF54_01870 [Holosporaceae bacterium]|jgi:hypothetical protein|nr:hypothetical protein [Holosporaceae bacterium]
MSRVFVAVALFMLCDHVSGMLVSSVGHGGRLFFGGRMFSAVADKALVMESVAVVESMKKILSSERKRDEESAFITKDFRVKQSGDLRIPFDVSREVQLAIKFDHLKDLEMKASDSLLKGRIEIFLRRFSFGYGNDSYPGISSCDEFKRDLEVLAN